MGINGILPYIKAKHPGAIERIPERFKRWSGKSLAVDGNLLLAKLFYSNQEKGSTGLTLTRRHVHLLPLIELWRELRHANITPYFIFDGSRHEQKLQETLRRKELNNLLKARIEVESSRYARLSSYSAVSEAMSKIDKDQHSGILQSIKEDLKNRLAAGIDTAALVPDQMLEQQEKVQTLAQLRDKLSLSQTASETLETIRSVVTTSMDSLFGQGSSVSAPALSTSQATHTPRTPRQLTHASDELKLLQMMIMSDETSTIELSTMAKTAMSNTAETHTSYVNRLPPRPEHMASMKAVLSALGVAHHTSEQSHEAEAYCSALQRAGLVSGVLSADTDILLYSATLISYRIAGHLTSISGAVAKLALQLNSREFIDFALLCGTDFSPIKLPRVGIVGAKRLIDKHRSIEKILDDSDVAAKAISLQAARMQITMEEVREQLLLQTKLGREVFEQLPLLTNVDWMKTASFSMTELKAVLRQFESNLPEEVMNLDEENEVVSTLTTLTAQNHSERINLDTNDHIQNTRGDYNLTPEDESFFRDMQNLSVQS